MEDFMEDLINIENMDEAIEETLSLCDLAANNEDVVVEWEDFSSVSQSSSSISSSVSPQEEDLFEFFSEDWSTNSTPYPPENVIFCGKRIDQEKPISKTIEKVERKRRLFRWHSDSLSGSTQASRKRGYSLLKKNEQKLHNISSSRNSDSLLGSVQVSHKSNDHKNNKKENKQKVHDISISSSTQTSNSRNYDLSNHSKMSILTSPSKSRWRLFFFGIARFPSEMELRNIKSRQQSRRCTPSPSPLFQINGGDHAKKKAKGLWGLIKVLGCISHRHATTITASIQAIPRV